jgi:hypothetical protein
MFLQHTAEDDVFDCDATSFLDRAAEDFETLQRLQIPFEALRLFKNDLPLFGFNPTQ